MLVATFIMTAAAPIVWEIVYPMPYTDLIHQYAEQNGLDPYLVAAVIRAESKFNKTATSRRDARGLMQILPSTGAWIATTIGLQDFTADMLYEPKVSIMLGTWYLQALLSQFDDNLPAALAAYNAGRTVVQNWLDEGCWDGSVDSIETIPYGETRDYVTRVLRGHDIYSALYGPDATLATAAIRRAWARLSR